jgi:hypothetical protein
MVVATLSVDAQMAYRQTLYQSQYILRRLFNLPVSLNILFALKYAVITDTKLKYK